MRKVFLKKLGLSSMLILGTLMLQNCSGEDAPGTEPKPEPTSELPVAKDDSYSTAENQKLVISDLLENDIIYDYGRIKEFDESTVEGGKVEANNDGSLTYFPPDDFIGKDSFHYSLCDAELPANCSTAKVSITVTDAGEPVANDDSYEAVENKKFNINNFLENDVLIDGATLSEIDDEGLNGVLVDNGDGTLSYTSNNGFTGEDSFTYTICDSDETPSCSTATITITVVDEGSPSAEDDKVVMNSTSTEVVLDNLLENDDLIDDAFIKSVDDSSASGTAVLNADGTVTYSPATGFQGEDTFTYTLCDDDATATCVVANVTVSVVESISFNFPDYLEDYYAEVTFSRDPELLYDILSTYTTTEHTNRLEYYQRHDYLYDADEDPSNPENVILIYTGDSRSKDEFQAGDLSEGETFNTEHIYPQSRLSSDEAKNDMHHMRVADVNINSERLNYPYTDGSGAYKLVDGDKWFPGDDWRGDVARMVMYVNLRYGEPFGDVGSKQLFLKWNIEDPVSAFEIQRNNVIEAAQGNRNPFIDNPYLATLIWGGEDAENRWE
ncbi:Ig-like domain-containing protein [Christiangramia aestuarii]|uniref:Tandem-95 repeat protein n=1 Tax=Christiangramia aestuarii TaxID=1028746 RepID=A0A7K1LRJ3_9FLAO|nr:Ig-like domain-containing protein [Christiangramia aestuarii]MUP43231.1 tandem-95 repeat protein [Christiangramia aestuarii]